jgi:hypothetical protein
MAHFPSWPGRREIDEYPACFQLAASAQNVASRRPTQDQWSQE